MNKYGLIGYPLGYSFSKKYFTEKFAKENIENSVYDEYPIADISEFPTIVAQNPELNGLNVTIPYKQLVMKYLDDIDATALEVGAINTVKFIKNKTGIRLKGYNSDIYGFEQSLAPLLKPHHTKALILGTGGASKAIKFVLNKLNIQYISASIEELNENEIRYEDITEQTIAEYPIIINATPLGTYPKVENCPAIPYHAITSEHILYDLVYNPEITKFISLGMQKGATTINGLKMLLLQAEKSWSIWNE